MTLARGAKTPDPEHKDAPAAGTGKQRPREGSRLGRGFARLSLVARSPMARKIIVFNLIGLVLLAAGILLVNPFHSSVTVQKERDLGARTELLAQSFELQLQPGAAPAAQLDRLVPMLAQLRPGPGTEIYLLSPAGEILGSTLGAPRGESPALSLGPAGLTEAEPPPTLLMDALTAMWRSLSGALSPTGPAADVPPATILAPLVAGATGRGSPVTLHHSLAAGELFAAVAPLRVADEVVALLAMTAGPEDAGILIRAGQEQVVRLFLITVLISALLSLILAATIANPLSELAAAAEIGNERKRSVSPGRVRIPDLSGRPDEIGRLSAALRGMVAALYDRIDANEQFAADVAHEIKNPLASLRSAVGSLRLVKKEEHRLKLLDVIEHDVRRLDRLVSDISNASRLDSELVKEDEQPFNLLKTLAGLTAHMAGESQRKGVEFITDLPPDPIIIQGLEARLAQVFVNLISNAISFCEEGDAIRVWARRRENRVLVVVEDTGPGIPDQALTRIFKRFYSDRPESHFGNNSGLGLAISKQIVEAHGGVIWAENIRPTDADPDEPPLGARFVVGLPV